MSIETFMVFLSLEDVDEVSSLNRNTCDIMDFILSFLLVIWWIWNLKVLLVSLVIYTHESELRKAMFETDAIKPDWSNLNSDGTFSRSSWVDLWEMRFFYDKFSHGFLCVSISLACLFLSQLCDLEWPQNSSNWNSQRIKSHELAVMTVKFKFDTDFRLSHFSVFFLTIKMAMTFASCTLN